MNSEKRQRLSRIKPIVKQLIASQATRYREKPRLALAHDLKDEIERMGEAAPSHETLIKMISDARNHEASPLEAPWHMGTLQVQPLPAESIPYIFSVQNWNEPDGPISIRNAIWISRLCRVYPLPMTKEQTSNLAFFADYYSKQEIVSELSGAKVFDTIELDAAMRKGQLIKLFKAD